MRVLLLPRGRTAVWTADLDGDGYPEWILESQSARAIFSTQDGGRWMEFTAKDANVNVLPDGGAFVAAGPVEVHANGDTLEFQGKTWNRTVRLSGNVLTVEQTSALPVDSLAPGKHGAISLTIDHASPTRAVYTLSQ